MDKIYIIRNNQQFGPYDPNTLLTYVNNGNILLSDQAFIDANSNYINTAGYFLKKLDLKVDIKHKGNLFLQIKDIGRELILPNDVLSKTEIFKDKRLLILALLGLTPAFLIRFTFIPFITFYTIALYFSIIWGLFFFHFFKTAQVQRKTTISIFFGLQICVFILWDIFQLPSWPGISWIYSLIQEKNWFLNSMGYILGVGLFEELVKALPLFILVRWAKRPIIPQTLVFYGLMSGIAFGVFEGVQYQMEINSTLDYSNAFFMNIARLTCLPFLHAVWTGIAGYFMAFARLYPKYRISLYFLSIGIPATLHGLYDALGWSFPGLAITLLSVILLMSYLKQGVNYQSKLNK